MTQKDIQVAVIVPCYDHSRTIGAVVAAASLQHEVIVVDDGSTEPLPPLPSARVVRHPRNRGKGAAILTGARAARDAGATHVITMDADGQHRAEDLPALVDVAAADPRALVVGRRELGGAHVPASSRYGREWSNLWITFHNGEKCEDALSGLRVYPIDALLENAPRSPGFEAESEVLIRWGRAGWPIRWVGVGAHYPPEGQRVSHFHKGRDNWRLTRLHARYFPGSLWRRATGTAGRRPDWRRAPRGTRGAYHLIGLAIRLAGRRLSYGIAWLVIPYFVVFSPGSVRHVRRFLRQAAPERRVGVFRTFHAFAVSLIDRVARVNGVWSEPKLLADGADRLKAIMDRAGRVIFLSAHFGHWDVGSRIAIQYGYPIAVVMHRDQADFAQDYFERHGDERVRVLPVDEERFVVDIVNALRDGSSVAMHGDRVLDGQRPVTVPFLGHAVALPAGPYQIAMITDTPVLPIFFPKKGPDAVEIWVGELIVPHPVARAKRAEEVARMAALYARELEAVVRRFPEQWYNFHDFIAAGDAA